MADEGNSYVWLDTQGSTVFGSGTLTAKRLKFETMNRKRAEAIREVMASLCPRVARYRLTQHVSIERALAQAKSAAPRPKGAEAIPPEIEHQLLHELDDRHYHEWLDTPLPALRGRTPRHAVTLKTLRPAVVDLLKELECHTEREKLAGRFTYDSSWMWAALGLEHERS